MLWLVGEELIPCMHATNKTCLLTCMIKISTCSLKSSGSDIILNQFHEWIRKELANLLKKHFEIWFITYIQAVEGLSVYESLHLGGRGDWSSDGCSVAGTSGLTVTCTCNHLTNFGVVAVSLICTTKLVLAMVSNSNVSATQNTNPIRCNVNTHSPSDDFSECIGKCDLIINFELCSYWYYNDYMSHDKMLSSYRFMNLMIIVYDLLINCIYCIHDLLTITCSSDTRRPSESWHSCNTCKFIWRPGKQLQCWNWSTVCSCM